MRNRSWPVIAGVALVGAVVTGCASGPQPGRASRSGTGATTPGRTPTSSPAPDPAPTRTAAACGAVPASSGPAAAVARLTLSAPATGPSGATVPVEARIEVHRDAPRIITAAAASQILVTQHGRVVGSTASGAGAAVPVPLRAGTTRPAQVLPATVRLVGCTVDTPAPALPPGRYELVGVLAYGGDPLDNAQDGVAGTRAFLLVSAPVAITVQ